MTAENTAEMVYFSLWLKEEADADAEAEAVKRRPLSKADAEEQKEYFDFADHKRKNTARVKSH
jgi:hypothetical protein